MSNAMFIIFCIAIYQHLLAVNGQYVFTDKAPLQVAIAAWIADETAATSTYGLINSWDVSAVTDMSELFKDKTAFNSDISSWNVGNVTTMQSMFNHASAFNKDISRWNVASVTAMQFMFHSAFSFNQDISRWNVASVTNMYATFYKAVSFNQDISSWNITCVTTVREMFFYASAFNQQLCWNVSGKITSNMFTGTAGASAIVCPPTGQPTSTPTGQPTSQPTIDTSFKKHVKYQVEGMASNAKKALEQIQSEMTGFLKKFRRAIEPPGYREDF